MSAPNHSPAVSCNHRQATDVEPSGSSLPRGGTAVSSNPHPRSRRWSRGPCLNCAHRQPPPLTLPQRLDTTSVRQSGQNDLALNSSHAFQDDEPVTPENTVPPTYSPPVPDERFAPPTHSTNMARPPISPFPFEGFPQSSPTETHRHLAEMLRELNQSFTMYRILSPSEDPAWTDYEVGLSDDGMSRLAPESIHRNRPATESASIKCCICLNGLEEGERIRTLPCKHLLHKDCVDPWLKKHPRCPLCRTEIMG